MYPDHDPDWPPRERHRGSGVYPGGYPDFGRYYDQPLLRGEPPRPDPREATTEELGAEPVLNGPTGKNHMAWCKQRALAYIPDIGKVIASLVEDFTKDERTAGSVDTIQHLMLPLTLMGKLNDPVEQRKFVLGFN